MSFTKEAIDRFKNIFHPNLAANLDRYEENGIYRFPPYHGCGLRNRNETNKSIDYKRGYQCLFPIEKQYWEPYKQISKSKIKKNVKFTRCMSNLGINSFAKTKNNMWYDWNENCYKPRANWYKHMDPWFEYGINNCPL